MNLVPLHYSYTIAHKNEAEGTTAKNVIHILVSYVKSEDCRDHTALSETIYTTHHKNTHAKNTILEVEFRITPKRSCLSFF